MADSPWLVAPPEPVWDPMALLPGHRLRPALDFNCSRITVDRADDDDADNEDNAEEEPLTDEDDGSADEDM